MKPIKLVIWDLDETFWKGTLSEGEVLKIPENIELVKTFTDRGIMNSIVSKNDREKVINVLNEWGIRDYFIFPKISWQPKGEIVKSLLEEIKLRAENVIFIDDNHSNRGEVEFYNKGITCIHPDQLVGIINDPAFKGKDDSKHSRLRQYHIMEQRSIAETKFSSNEEFLRSSHIKIQICSDCLSEEARIYELIQRTNQLNYTKIRSTQEEVHNLLQSDEYETRYIKASDDFGEYGIVGFYALKGNILKHFLFSCRTIGFGIENFLYKRLNFPELAVSGDVSTPLTKDMNVDWIQVSEEEKGIVISKGKNENIRILMVAGCDLEQATAYLESQFTINKEFTTVIDGHEIRTSDLCSLVNTKQLDEKVKKELCDNLPFVAEGITFNSKIYSGDYDIIVLSVVDDYIRGMYKHNDSDYYVGYGGYFDQDEMRQRYPEEEWHYLDKNFSYIGQEPLNDFKYNLNFVLSGIPSKTKVLLINGTDIDVSDWIGQERVQRNIDMNKIVDEVASQYSNVFLIDMRKIVSSPSDLSGMDNRHYNRKVYYKMAQAISAECNNVLGAESFRVMPQNVVNMKKRISRFFSKFSQVILKIRNIVIK